MLIRAYRSTRPAETAIVRDVSGHKRRQELRAKRPGVPQHGSRFRDSPWGTSSQSQPDGNLGLARRKSRRSNAKPALDGGDRNEPRQAGRIVQATGSLGDAEV